MQGRIDADGLSASDGDTDALTMNVMNIKHTCAGMKCSVDGWWVWCGVMWGDMHVKRLGTRPD